MPRMSVRILKGDWQRMRGFGTPRETASLRSEHSLSANMTLALTRMAALTREAYAYRSRTGTVQGLPPLGMTGVLRRSLPRGRAKYAAVMVGRRMRH